MITLTVLLHKIHKSMTRLMQKQTVSVKSTANTIVDILQHLKCLFYTLTLDHL